MTHIAGEWSRLNMLPVVVSDVAALFEYHIAVIVITPVILPIFVSVLTVNFYNID